MTEIVISLSDFIEKREARIGGKLYTVRQLGAGEQLDLSRIYGKIFELSKSAEGIEDLAKASKIMEQVVGCQNQISKIYEGLFTTKDGDVSALLAEVGVQNMPKLIDMVFYAKQEAIDG